MNNNNSPVEKKSEYGSPPPNPWPSKGDEIVWKVGPYMVKGEVLNVDKRGGFIRIKIVDMKPLDVVKEESEDVDD